MTRKVITGTISTSNDLNPAIGCFRFGIPTVTGVVGHLVLHMLAEAEFIWRYSNLREIEVDAANEVT